MPEVNKLSGVAIANIEKVDGVVKVNIGKISGIDFSSAETHVFLLAGQSNMVGRATFDSGAGYPAGTLQYPQATGYPTYTDTTTIAAAPILGHWDGVAGDMGLAINFAIDYVAATGAQVVFIPAADGGTGFVSNNWNPGDTQYDHAVNATNALMAANPDWIFKGILWHQGERDSTNGSFEQQFYLMIQQMREDINDATQQTPFILGELLVGGSGTTTLNSTVLSNTPTYNYETALVSSASLTSFDNLHFDAASLRTFGSRYENSFTGLNNPYPTAESGAAGHWIFGTSNQLYIDLTGSATNLVENNTDPADDPVFALNTVTLKGAEAGLLSDISDTPDFTMCFVVKANATSTGKIIGGNLGFPSSVPGGNSFFISPGNEIRWNERSGAGLHTLVNSASIVGGGFYFIAVSIDSSDNFTLYAGDSTSPTSVVGVGAGRQVSTRKMSVGNVHYPDPTNFDGDTVVCEAIFFNSAKREADFLAIYNRSVSRMSARNITLQ